MLEGSTDLAELYAAGLVLVEELEHLLALRRRLHLQDLAKLRVVGEARVVLVHRLEPLVRLTVAARQIL